MHNKGKNGNWYQPGSGRRIEYDWNDRRPSLAQIVIWTLFAAMIIGAIVIAVF